MLKDLHPVVPDIDYEQLHGGAGHRDLVVRRTIELSGVAAPVHYPYPARVPRGRGPVLCHRASFPWVGSSLHDLLATSANAVQGDTPAHTLAPVTGEK